MINLADYQEENGGRFPGLSLSKVTGLKIVDVVGFVSTEFGEPVFKLSSIKYENGESSFCEGEHDMPYLESIPVENGDDLLQELYDAED